VVVCTAPGTEILSLLKSGVVRVVPLEFAILGRFRDGKFRLGKLSGGREDKEDVPESPVVVEIGVVDGKLRDGSDNGGIVGTESGGKPGDV